MNFLILGTDEKYVDAAAMFLITKPQDFDVIVTTNLFGDILSDEGAGLVGGLGMVPSANIGDNNALFEPVHGSAPDIAGLRNFKSFCYDFICGDDVGLSWRTI